MVARHAHGRALEQYEQDLFFRSAVERQVEIIGEAARGISRTLKAAHPDIPWRPIISQRHRLAHEYGEIDDNLIWKVATVHGADSADRAADHPAVLMSDGALRPFD